MNKFFRTLTVAAISTLTCSLGLKAQTIDDGLHNLDSERFSQAGKVFEQLVASAPTGENYFYQGYYYLNTPERKLDLAKAAFEKGLLADKKPNPLCSVGLGAIKIAQKDLAGAKAAFELVKKETKGKNTDVLFRIGEAYTLFEESNDPAEAVLNIQEALDKQKVKDNPDYYIAMANAYLIKNDGGAAMTALENALRMGKKVAKIKTLMGRVWIQGKNYKEAITQLNDAVAADAKYAPAYYQKSVYYQIYQKYGEAAENANLYLTNSDADCGAKLRYVKLAYLVKDYKGALEKIEDVKNCSKDDIVYRLEGFSQFELGNASKSIELIKTFLSKADKDRVLGMDYGYLGRSYVALQNAEAKAANDSIGIEYMKKAISMKDTSYDYASDIVKVYKAAKRFDMAATTMEEIIKTKAKPSGQDYANLGMLYYQGKDWNKADVAFDKVCEVYGDTWDAAYLYSARIKSYKNVGDTTYIAAPRYEKYISLLTEAKKTSQVKNLAEAIKYLAGKAFMVDKDVPKATALLNELLKYDPQNQDALKLLQNVTGTAAPATTTPVTPGSSGKNP